MLRRPMRSLIVSLALALFAPVVASAGGAPAACDGGRFVVSAPLLPGRASGGDAIEIAAGRAAIDGGCGSTAAKVKRTRKGTKVTARWKDCAGQPGKVKLTALIDPTCATLAGKVTVARTKPRYSAEFSAPLETTTRACDLVPGDGLVAAAPAPDAARTPRARPPIRPANPRFQEGYLRALWGLIRDVYVDPAMNGLDWNAILDEYLAKIAAGLTAEAFYDAMAELVEELGDDHSNFLDPEEAEADAADFAGGSSFVGMGVSVDPIPETREAVILSVRPNSPAAEAGIRAHDVIVAMNGVPYVDEAGEPIEPPAAGVEFDLTWRRPGGAEQTTPIVRRAIGGFDPLDHCIVDGTGILYLHLPSFFDITFPPRVRRILEKVGDDGISALVVDVRKNPGGSSVVARPLLGLFTSGEQGRYVGRTRESPLVAEPVEDVDGSQFFPLAILIGPDSVSFAEIWPGVLQSSGRATLVGETTAGNVEALSGYEFVDGAVVFIAEAAFAPTGLPAGVWEGVGVEPDVTAPGAWHEFTEATDPTLAAAVELLAVP